MEDKGILEVLDKYLAGRMEFKEERKVEQWLEEQGSMENEWEEMDEISRAEYLKAVYLRIWNTIGDRRQESGVRSSVNGDVSTRGIEKFDNGELSTRGIDIPENKEDGNIEQGTRNDEFRRKGKVKRMQIIKWIAAASIIGFVVWSLVFVVNRNKGEDLPVAVTPKVEDVKAPETNRAMITLSDGRVVYLDSAGNGSLANVSGVEVIKLSDGKIVYKETGDRSQETVYNTLTNPLGSKVIDMTLSDGSRVWLNAGSSVTYPVVFVGNERKVTMRGEAYFEVNTLRQAQGDIKRKIPFIVSNGSMEVEVLGTQFNVNAYEDEEVVRVTLLEGSVNVKRERSIVRLVPGEQATLRQAQSDITVLNNVDIEAVMAWKNGLFFFKDADVKTVMKEMVRWYDIEVVYEGKVVPRRFSGKIGRDLSLADVMDALAKNQVKFRIEGKKVVVE